MSATVNNRPANELPVSRPGVAGSRLLGLGNLVSKDLLEWRRGRRAWVVLGVTSFFLVFSAADARLTEFLIPLLPAESGALPPQVGSLLPMDNLIEAIGSQFFAVAAIFATISLLISEREAGTLGWTVSKPVSRTSVWLSKWLSATAMLWLAAVVIPIALTVVVVTILYGLPDLSSAALLAIALATVPALYAAVTLTASTFISSQAGVAAIGLAVFFVPDILTGIVPALRPFLPTSIFPWIVGLVGGADVPLITPFAWAIGIGLLVLISSRRMARLEL
jgi:ABC-type transport system involved in multi-copper enzyme maturation permease subunit